MRYFAQVENGIVQRVSIGESPDTLSASFTWVETFLDGGSRRNMAVAGGNYNSENDVFYAEQPYDSWTIDPEVARWVSPAGDEPILTHEQIMAGSCYMWDESTYQWRLVTRD